MVKPEINTAADLKGKTLATPQLGNTQDVALRAWLADAGLRDRRRRRRRRHHHPDRERPDPHPVPGRKLDGAWLPEPWASRLVLDAGAHVLVDETDLWDGSLSGKAARSPPPCCS